ncbi:MAG: AlpA family phage regulatory protein [Geobacteraceae bacterium]|nr:AlpA family phage regulatory protein [Geobacteraceae bacterium]
MSQNDETSHLPPCFDPNRLIRLKEVLKLVPVAGSTWWAWVASGKAPSPIRLGSRCTCWRAREIYDFLEQASKAA